jgi:hypothetical protein
MTKSQVQSSSDRRIYTRYQMPVSALVEARWNGQRLPLAHDPQHENISALGLRVALQRGPAPPVGARLDIRFPLVEKPSRPGRTYAHCLGRVVRHDGPNLVAVYLQDVNFVAEDVPARAASARVLVRA